MTDWMVSLAVVPIGRRPGGTQWLLSFWPYLVAIAFIIAGAIVAFWLMKRRLGLAAATGGLMAILLLGAGAIGLAVMGQRMSHTHPNPPEVDLYDSWLTFMNDSSRAGHAPGAVGPKSARKVWSYIGGLDRAPFSGSAAVVGGRVFVGCDNQQLHCFHADTGDVLWKFQARHELFAAPVVAEGRVYLGEGLHEHEDARLYCLDASTGKKQWEFATAGHIEFSPTYFRGRLYVPAGPDGVYCLDAATGQAIWHARGLHVDLSPAVTAEGVFFGTSYGEAAFYCLKLDDGSIRWKRPAPQGVCGSPSTDGQRIYFGMGNGTFDMSHAQPEGMVACLSAADGQVLWKAAHVKDTVLTSIALWQGRTFFASRDGVVHCLEADTGRVIWTHPAPDAVVSSPAVGDGRVYFGCDDAHVYCLDAATGRPMWKYDTSRAIFNPDARVMSSPAIVNGRLYVGSMNFHFFCLGEE